MKKEITESDWVGIRAIFLLLEINITAINLPEVRRILDFYEHRYGSGRLIRALGSLKRELS